jgi:hypothetical protein
LRLDVIFYEPPFADDGKKLLLGQEAVICFVLLASVIPNMEIIW